MKQIYMRQLLTVVLLLVSLSAKAGMFDSLFDGCEGKRSVFSSGKSLEIIFGPKLPEIGADGSISTDQNPNRAISIRDGRKRYGVTNDTRFLIKDLPTEKFELLKKTYAGTDKHGVIITILDLDGKSDHSQCLVSARFDSFNEFSARVIKNDEERLAVTKAQEESNQKTQGHEKQCHLDFDAIPEEGGSLAKLDELATHCTNYVSTILRYCNVYGGSGCREVNAKEVSEKWERILMLRQKQLLAGSQKIQDFRDATLLNQPEGLEPIMANPLLKPDIKIYGNRLYAMTLDAQEKNNLLRGKIIFGESSSGEVNFKYVYLRTNEKTVIFNPGKLRVGVNISVIGRYVSNATYTTLAGAKKMAPVLDILFIE